MRKRHQLLLTIAVALVVVAAVVAVLLTQALRPAKHVVVMFSNTADQYAYVEFRKTLEKKFDKLGVKADITYLYLECERFSHDIEIQHAKVLVEDVMRSRRIDALITVGDQATYSLAQTGMDIVHNVPWVFVGVMYPNAKILENHTNLRGFTNTPDVPRNILLSKTLTGNAATFTLIDRTYLDKLTMRNINEQLAGRNDIINNLDWKYAIVQLEQHHRDKGSITPFSLRNISSNTAMKEDQAYQGTMNLLHATRRYSEMTYIQFKFDTAALALIGFRMEKPMLTAVWLEFGKPGSNFLGGYFVSGTTMANDAATSLSETFKGQRSKGPQLRASKNDYLIDYQVAKRYGYTIETLPEGMKVVNLGWRDHYPRMTITLITLAILLILSLFIYMYIVMRRERKEKRIAMEQKEHEQQMYSMAVLNSNTFVWERMGDVLNITNSFWQHFNLHAHPIDIHDFARFIHPDDVPIYLDGTKKTMRGETSTNEVRADFTGQGTYSWWQIRARGIVNEEGKFVKPYGMLIDIEDFKQREQALEEARKLAEEANLKESFLANMSHEIRTPLNAIVGFSNLLASDEEFEEEDRKMFIDTINKNNDLLLKLINDILDISRIESGQMAFSIKPSSMQEMMGHVFQSFSVQVPKHLDFIFDHPNYDVMVNMDAMRMQQVMTNFLTNAAKFTPEGSITLGWNYNNLTDEIEAYVEDTGIGLSEGDRKMVFSRFYKIDEFKQGTGLGLSICKVIVSRLSGRISVKSTLGKGSRFSVFLRVTGETVRKL